MFENGIIILDWLGVIVFAMTGALVASRNQMDAVGFVLLGTVTGVGGGTIRDLLLDSGSSLRVGSKTLRGCENSDAGRLELLAKFYETR